MFYPEKQLHALHPENRKKMDASAVNCQMQRTELQMDAVNEFKVNLFIETKIRNSAQMHIDDKSKNKKKKNRISLWYIFCELIRAVDFFAHQQ